MNIIFDWAGTLADDQEVSWRLTNETLRIFGHAPVTMEVYQNEFTLPAVEFYRKYGPKTDWEEIESVFSDLCLRRYSSQVNLWPGVREGLACLACKHTLYLFSSLNEPMLEQVLQALELRKYFHGVYGSVSDKTAAMPALIKDLGLSPDETVAVGDMAHDIEAAKASKVQALAVSYGYGKPAMLAEVDPDATFKSFSELMRYFDKLSFAESRFFPVATVGGLIFDDRGEVLLVRTRKWSDLFGIPGGKIEYGESMQDAFVREAKEETGLDIDRVEFIMNQDCIEHPEFYRPRHFLLINFKAKVTGTRPRIKLNYESEAYMWVTPRAAMELSLNGPTRILLEKYLELEEA